VHDAAGAAGGVLAWLVNTAASALIGLVVGAAVVAVVSLLPFGRGHAEKAAH
jgi:predicted DNA repair protein MutK